MRKIHSLRNTKTRAQNELSLRKSTSNTLCSQLVQFQFGSTAEIIALSVHPEWNLQLSNILRVQFR